MVIDIPDATIIIIENAERFGLAQLHQLRGRVGRSSLQSYCILMYGKNISEVGKLRLKTMRDTDDGFFIAEKDLVLRGPGEVFGTRQSCENELKLLHFIDKEKLMKKKVFPKPNQITRDTLRKILKGKIKIDAEIDLHGLDRFEARDIVESFIHKSFINAVSYTHLTLPRNREV